MSVEFVSILVLCAIFLLATLLPIHMGVLGIGAAFVVGMFVLDGPLTRRSTRSRAVSRATCSSSSPA